MRFNEKSLIKDVFEDDILCRYAKYLGFDFWEENQDLPLSYFYEHTVEFINKFYELAKDNKTSIYAVSDDRPDATLIHLKHNDNRHFAICAAGGGYSAVCTYIESLPLGILLYEAGYDVFLLTYGVKEMALMPGPIDDLAHAVEFIVKNKNALNVEIENYLVHGSSAAGHLIAEWGTNNHGYATYKLPKPGLISLQYPVITFSNTTHQGSKDQAIGKNPSIELCHEYSVEEHVDKTYPKTFIVRAEDDPEVPVHYNSDHLVEELEENEIEHVYVILEGNAHAFGIGVGTKFYGWTDKLIKFYKQILMK